MKGQCETLSSHAESFTQFFMEQIWPFLHILQKLDSSLDSASEPVVGDPIHHELNRAFHESIRACREFENSCNGDRAWIESVQRAFRRATEPWFQHSWYARRARTKPSGFPGDFQMLLKLYQGRTPARGLGGYLDLCLGELPLARAVASRLAAVRQFLLNHLSAQRRRCRILNVACGPCYEYEQWPAHEMDQTCDVFALDNDPAALDYVRREVIPRLPSTIQLQPVHMNALRTRSAEANWRRFGRIDIIYSVGSCDYLPDRVLIELLRGWYDTLDDDGLLYVAFKDAERYDKTPYQWHLDWYFYQRTYGDVVNLYEQAGLAGDHLIMERDASGIIMNFVVSKSTQAARRVLRLDMHEGILRQRETTFEQPTQRILPHSSKDI